MQRGLPAKTQLLDNIPIPFDIGGFKIVKKTSPTADQPEEANPGVVVFLVDFEMFGEFLDPL